MHDRVSCKIMWGNRFHHKRHTFISNSHCALTVFETVRHDVKINILIFVERPKLLVSRRIAINYVIRIISTISRQLKSLSVHMSSRRHTVSSGRHVNACHSWILLRMMSQLYTDVMQPCPQKQKSTAFYWFINVLIASTTELLQSDLQVLKKDI